MFKAQGGEEESQLNGPQMMQTNEDKLLIKNK